MHSLALLVHIPLDHAYLCQDCMMIGNQPKVCPACASSTSLLSLSAVLNRSAFNNQIDMHKPKGLLSVHAELHGN